MPGVSPQLSPPYGPSSPRLPAPDTSGAQDELAWFQAEVQPHEPALRQFLRPRVGRAADVDDVVQESFIKVLRARSAGQIRSAKAFLFTVARNTANNFFRKEKIYAPVPVDELPEWRVLDGGQDVSRAVNQRLQSELLAEAVAELPERCRKIFLLRVSDGLSYAEIAGGLAVSESTVRTQMARALAKCAETLEKKGVGKEQ